MLQVVHYLEKEKTASYKQIAEALGVKERNIRYDIERINDELSLLDCPLIEKRPKGILFVPDGLDFSVIVEDEEFIFSPQERVNLIKMIILFDTEKLNIRLLSDTLQVSRRSIQNDIDLVQRELEPAGLTLNYNRRFYLTGESGAAYRFRAGQLRRYVKLLYHKKIRNTYEQHMDQQIHDFFAPVDMDAILDWITALIQIMKWKFSDDSYLWYVANVLTFSWYIKNNIPFSFDMENVEGIIDLSIPDYEEIMGKRLSRQERGILSGFVRFTSRHDVLDTKLDLIQTQELASELISRMGQVLNMDFSSDKILRKGLLNHIGPMIERVRGGMQLNEEAESVIPEEYFDIYQRMKSVIRMDSRFYMLTENEIVYLTMYFLGSIRRMKKTPQKNVLLVCGFGYGTTVVVKDTLISKYQVNVIESISTYEIHHYQNWDEVDMVVSTVKIDLPVEKKLVVVNVIFNEEDHRRLQEAGIWRRNALNDFMGIERKLDFLRDSDRNKVMQVIREEFGYQNVKVSGKYETISDLIHPESVRIMESIDDWEKAVAKSAEILVLQGSITGRDYYNSIIHMMQVQGFYAVTDGKFALLHGSGTAGVNESCMSLIITKEPVFFGPKKANVIFCLASKDKKEHIPVIVNLMRMIGMTDFLEELKHCVTTGEVMGVIHRCETEVEHAGDY